MIQEHDIHRRSVLKGAAALGATASVAGCSEILGGGDGDGDGDLSYGDEVEGELTEDDDPDPHRNVVSDAHEFTASSGDEVVITMQSEPLDPYLVLTNSDDGVVATNDDSIGLDSQITTTIPEDGTYTIWASRYDGMIDTGEDTGTYTLTLEEA